MRSPPCHLLEWCLYQDKKPQGEGDGNRLPVSSPYEQKTAPRTLANLSSILIGLNGATCLFLEHSWVGEWEHLETSHELGVGQLLHQGHRVGFPWAISAFSRREGREVTQATSSTEEPSVLSSPESLWSPEGLVLKPSSATYLQCGLGESCFTSLSLSFPLVGYRCAYLMLDFMETIDKMSITGSSTEKVLFVYQLALLCNKSAHSSESQKDNH